MQLPNEHHGNPTTHPLEEILSGIRDEGLRLISEVNMLSFKSLTLGLSADEEEARRKIEQKTTSPSARLKEIVPLPSILIDLSEMRLCEGNRKEALRMLDCAKERLASAGYIHASNPAMILDELALLQAKVGLETTGLDEALDLLKGLPKQFPQVKEGLRSVAMTAVGCLHLSSSSRDYARFQSIIESSVRLHSRKKQERDDLLGLVARNVCMRDGSEAASDDALIEYGEKLLRQISDPMEVSFTLCQLGIARSLRGDEEKARNHFDECLGMVTPRADDDRFKYASLSNLFRAYYQAGFLDLAEEMRSRVRREFDELIGFSRDTMKMIREEKEFLGGRRLPDELRGMVEQLEYMTNAFTYMLVSPFELSGRVRWKEPSNGDNRVVVDEMKKRYLVEACEMLEQIPVDATKTRLCLELSKAHSAIGNSDASIEMLHRAVKASGGGKPQESGEGITISPEDVASAYAEGYFFTHDERFASEFLQFAKVFGIKGATLYDISYKFFGALSALSRDKRWRITFYVNG
jgi:tetratricopeptide (TPR) repeat protein